ncbi:MAG: helix-turn-helix domain-containing protein [Nitrosomonadaceae bacterium]
MNDNDSGEIEAETEVESAEKTQSIGQVLQAARLAQVMSTQDIARQLRLSEKQVTAIEEDDHSKFPNQTFLRGFIRNYAKLVRKDTEEFSQLLQQTFPPVSTQAISYPVDGTPFTPDHKQSRGNIIIILVALLVSLLLIYEVYRSGGDDRQADTNIENGTIAEAAIQFETEVEQAPEDDQNQLPSVISSNGSNFNSLSEGAETDQQKNDNIEKKQQVKIAPEVENKPVKKEGERALRFIFNEDSWVEVKDAEGKRIFSQIGSGNTEKTVYGRAPFSLTIGNAANVKLVYNDKPVDLMPYTSKHGGVARLSLD